MEGTYRHLTLEERRTLFRLLHAKLPIKEIAGQLGRHRSTIYREIAGNEFREGRQYRGYYPVTAEDSAKRRRRRPRKLIRDAHLRGHVVEKLALSWSPEQIAGRLKRIGDQAWVSHETIYQFVYSPEGRALELHRPLLRARRLRRRRLGRKPRSLKIPLERTIAQRPAAIGERHAIGHREADLLIFQRAHGNANLTSLVARKSRLVRLLTNPDRRACNVLGAIGEALRPLPATARQSLTFDRGSEFLGYAELARSHGIDSYYRDPHSPWQKGSVENTNGRLRRFLPGELNRSTLTPARLQEIERQMNDTPRKCLGFRTPHEAFAAAAS
jgi:IS30 family transposase